MVSDGARIRAADHFIFWADKEGIVCIPTERDRGFRRMMTAESDDVDR